MNPRLTTKMPAAQGPECGLGRDISHACHLEDRLVDGLRFGEISKDHIRIRQFFNGERPRGGGETAAPVVARNQYLWGYRPAPPLAMAADRVAWLGLAS